MIVSVTSAGDVFFRINLQDGYHILDQTRLLMRYTSEINTLSRNMTSEQAFMNASSMFLEVPRSRVPYPRFPVQVAPHLATCIRGSTIDKKEHCQLQMHASLRLIITVMKVKPYSDLMLCGDLVHSMVH